MSIKAMDSDGATPPRIDLGTALAILGDTFVSEFPPWSLKAENDVDALVAGTIKALAAARRLKCVIETGDYGSGYASFLEGWLSREDASFRDGSPFESHRGLLILVSRRAPVFALGEGSRSWSPDKRSSSRSMPSWATVDCISPGAVADLVSPVTAGLEGLGMVRLFRTDLEPYLPSGVVVPTVLGDRPFRLFDAVFHWED